MTAAPVYDRIGIDYARLRRPDSRISGRIVAALGDAASVLNVGAGAGSYEATDRTVTALEPSAAMIAQRPPDAAMVVQGRAEALPFPDKLFDAAMAVLTVHHWNDQSRGLAEMRRVSHGTVVILTYDPAFRGAWLFEYFPGLVALDAAQMPPLEAYAAALGPVTVSPVPIPHDCTDGFLAAYWRRPRAYLDPRIRAAMSSFHALGDVSSGLSRLEADLASGAWQKHFGHLCEKTELDCGYRLIATQ